MIALIELATRDESTPVLVRDIALARDIPPAFFAKLVPPLVRAGILTSTRGKNGGISFARSPQEVSIADVVRTIEGDNYFRECVFELLPCDGRPDCPLHDVWDPIRDDITRFLEQTTIHSVADKLTAAKEEC
ncbi:Rrf2 family transcriptional regulator [Candidatus Bipolaricaulota bacterium]|nr:Rrf2 family transcriptional regulator [Candidatus Bipolaricaulota bacterium]